jgi:hypothetical protein
MKRTRHPIRHGVEFEVPPVALRKTDVVFKVFRDGERFGTLFVSRGALVWYPKNWKRGRKLSWSRFDAIAQESGTAVWGY